MRDAASGTRVSTAIALFMREAKPFPKKKKQHTRHGRCLSRNALRKASGAKCER
jgi:hypothetical protein